MWIPKVKYDTGAEIRLSTCTLDVKGVLGSYSKIQPATYTQISRATVWSRSQACRNNFQKWKCLDLHPAHFRKNKNKHFIGTQEFCKIEISSHGSPISSYDSLIASYGSRIASYGSLIASYGSLIASYGSPIASYGSLIASYGSPIVSHGSIIAS